MKQIHIKEIKTQININEILNAVSLNKKIEIDIDGKVYIDEEADLKKVIIFKLENFEEYSSMLDIKVLVKNIFNDYKPLLSGNNCTLNLLPAWQKIIFLNQNRMLYFDHQTDGVELFEDKELENIGWLSIVCDVSYREISDFIEANCNGTLVYYDNEIQFNGFVIVDDINDVRKKVKDFISNRIKEKIEEDLIDIDDDEVLESLEFFNIKV